MQKPKYYEIIKNIAREDMTDIDKGTAIMQMLNFATLNHVSKDELVEIIRYLFPFVYDWDGKECVPDTEVGDKWNKYPEAKPKDGQECLFWSDHFQEVKMLVFWERAGRAYFESKEWAEIHYVDKLKFAYWQPLPEPPEEES